MLTTIINKIKAKFFKDMEYVVAYRFISSEDKSLINIEDKKRFRLLRAGLLFWYADPLIFSFCGSTYVFMEQYDRIKCKGQIAVSELKRNGKLSRPRTVLSEPFHMSFPMVFEHNNRVYMCPESSVVEELRIYQMQEDIYHWKLYHSFSNMGKIVDTCVYEAEDGGIYLLTSKTRENPLLNERKLFWLSDDLKTIKDVSKAFGQDRQDEFETRNGGKIFRYQEKRYRVQQVSTSEIYGKEVKISRVQCCNSSLYKQEEVKCINHNNIQYYFLKCNFEPYGVHTYGMENNLEVLDVVAKSYKIKNAIIRVLKKIKNGDMM